MGCRGSPPHHLAVPKHAVKVRGKDGPPGCCLSTFPARPSVRNGEALSGIRRWLRVIVPLPRQPQHPNTVHGMQAQLAALERQQSDPSHEAMPRAPREGPAARPCLGAPYLDGYTLSRWIPDDSHKTTCNKQSGHVAELVAAVPHVGHTPRGRGSWGSLVLPAEGWWLQGTWPGSPGWRVPGGTAGSVLVSHIHLAALAEATPVPAKGLQ